MHEATRTALDDFNSQANFSSGNTNPHDYRRWVEFVSTALEHGDHLDEQDVRELLVEAGWDDERATRLASEFRVNLRFLEEYLSHS